MQSQHPRSALGVGSEQKESVPLAGKGVLGPWILGDSVTPGVGANVVASPLILGVLEHLEMELPQNVVGLGTEPIPKVCSWCKFKLEEPVPLFAQGFLCL